MERVDYSLDTLLILNGEIIVLDKGYWVKFEAQIIKQTDGRPYGIKYCLSLHNKNGMRVIGFDNAHKIPGKKDGYAFDHKHHVRHGTRTKAYNYKTADILISDFWKEVDEFLLNEE